MHLRFWCLLSALAAALSPLGCSYEDASLASDAQGPGVAGPDATLSFDPQTTLAIAPASTHQLTVVAVPPQNYELSFVLLGNTLNASLDRSTAVADATGRASVKLRAPDAPTTFRVRASLKEGPSAELEVAVSDEGFGSIRVVPIYHGKRPVETWTASMIARTNCGAVVASLPDDPPGAIQAISAGDDTPIIDSAPVGPNLAIALRAGHYIRGCADESDVAAGKQIDVKVTVTDVELDLSATNLDLDLTYRPDPDPYTAMMASALEMIQATYLPPGPDASGVLLDTMEQLVLPELAADFAATRMQNQWDSVAAEHFAKLDMTALPIGDQIGLWFDGGFAAEPPHLFGRLTAAGGVAGQALFHATKLGSADASEAGIPDAHLVKWQAFPGDQVLLSGNLFWLPSRYAGAVVWRGAKALSQASTMPEALAAAAECPTLAELLGGFATCDKTCLESLCQDALAWRWTLALDASASMGQIGELQISSASGTATINDVAAPTGIVDGSWVGTVTDGLVSVDIPASDVTGKEAPQQPAP